MRIHTTRLTLPLLVALIAAAAPASALAKETQKYSTTITSVPISTSNGYPLPGGKAVLAASIANKPFGAGAAIDRVTITGHPASDVFTFKGTEVDYYMPGAVRATLSGTATVQSDGSQRLSIQGKFAGGFGFFTGSTGHFTYAGVIPSGSMTAVGHSTGVLHY
jgi:hypothetical protein